MYARANMCTDAAFDVLIALSRSYNPMKVLCVCTYMGTQDLKIFVYMYEYCMLHVYMPSP